MSRARQIIESARRRRLNEGTVIVLNGDDTGQQTAQLRDMVREIVGELIGQGNGSGGGQEVRHFPAIEDNLQMQTGGRKWRFKVNRGDNGQIDNLDVSEG